jgi:hypothetical protein
MKNIINEKRIEDILNSFKSNESVNLSLSEKQSVLTSVFDRAEKKVEYVHNHKAIKSPFYEYRNHFVQYLRYSVPVILIAVIGTQMASVFNDRSDIALSEINDVKTSLSDLKRESEIKSNLSKNKQDIQEIKSLALSDQSAKTQILAGQVSTRSKEIRNQVASLVSENKITEAKSVALELETALKADDLYKVSTSVQQEVFEAIDIRVDIERKEKYNISTSTESDISKRIDVAKENLLTFDKNASTTEVVVDMMKSAEDSIENAEQKLKDKDFENAIISLQLYDRIVAELKTILLP